MAANAQGLALERRYGRSILSSFHAAFSAGGLAGAGLGALAAAAGIGPRAHFGALALAAGGGALAGGTPAAPAESATRAARRRILVRPPRALLVLGAAAFFTLLAEGAAADWSAVYLSGLARRDGRRGRARLHRLLARDGDEPRWSATA